MMDLFDPTQQADPNGLDARTPGAKLDRGKVMAELTIDGFARALMAVAEVSTYGAQKYSPGGWQRVADGQTRYRRAGDRHRLARGYEAHDQESGLLHLAHEAWNRLAELELALRATAGGACQPGTADGAPQPAPRGNSAAGKTSPATPLLDALYVITSIAVRANLRVGDEGYQARVHPVLWAQVRDEIRYNLAVVQYSSASLFASQEILWGGIHIEEEPKDHNVLIEVRRVV